MIFNPVRPGKRLFGGIRSSVFRVEIMFKTTVIVGADPVPVVTLQALFIAGGYKKGMRGGCAIGKIQMTRSAPGAVIDIRVVVAAGIEMAAQTAPTQQVVGQLQRCCRRIDNGDLGKPGKRFLGAKGLADLIDFLGQGKMNRLCHPCHLIRMASAAGLGHRCRVGGLRNKTGMGVFLIVAGVVAGMAG